MAKRKQIFNLLIVFFIILIIGYLGENLTTNYEETVEDKRQKNLRNSGYWVLDFIHVDGNWTLTNSTWDWCSGSGTEIDPYVIENVVIDGQNSSSCIIIENTIEYFEIRNCTLYNAGPEYAPDYDCGIRVENCSNVNLINNNCSYNNYFGIYLGDCTNFLIQGNSLSHNNKQGLITYFSQNGEISGNTVTNNSYTGAYLGYTDKIDILDNTFNNNSYQGFEMYDCDHCYFKNNTANYNLRDGLRINKGFNHTIQNNTLNYNIYNGLRLVISENCTIKRNVMNYNIHTGLSLVDIINSTIIDNNMSFNTVEGIDWEGGGGESRSNRIISNNITYNQAGIWFQNPTGGPIHYNTFSKNNISCNSYRALNVYLTNFNTFSDNLITNNIQDGVQISTSSNNTFIGNTIVNSWQGFSILANANNNTIIGNEINNTNTGIWISINSQHNKIIENNITQSLFYAIYVSTSDFNLISGNKIINVTDVNYASIRVINSHNNTFLRNDIHKSNNDGIYLENSHDNTISYHTIIGHVNGIYLYQSNFTNISNNSLDNNDVGIKLEESFYTRILENNVTSDGLYGIFLEDNDNNTISQNIINNKTQNGIYSYNCHYNNITGNVIFDNKDIAIRIYYSDFNNIWENQIFNNEKDAIWIYGCNFNNINGNEIYNNTQEGIYLRKCNNNSISTNSIIKNKENGIYLWECYNSSIIGNAIVDNTKNGVYLLESYNSTITSNYLICYMECFVEVSCSGNSIYGNEYYVNLTSTPIFIDGDSQWASIAGSEFWCNGSGIFNDPYVISHVYINGQDSGTCILIQNTTAYFRIEESVIFNSGSGSYDAGIKFINVTNGDIINTNCSLNQGSGIILLYSSNTTIFNNILENNPNSYGCWLIWSDNNNLTGNTAYNNNIGFGLNNSNFNDIMGNFLDFNSYGMRLGHSNNNTITGNTLNNNTLHGIFLYFSDYNFISGNNINGNEVYGVYLFSSDYNTISFNIFIYNVDGIVENGTSTGNVFEDNTIENREGDGVPVQPDNLIFIIIAVAGISVGVMGTIIYTQYRRIKRRKRTEWVKLKKKKGLISPELIEGKNLIFISYATKDSDLFQIPLITEVLTAYPEIEDVLYWESDMHDDIYEYMDDNLQLCKVFLLFCSQTSLASDAVKMEWRSALKLDKKIIPIFINPEDIPPLLTTKLGVQFDTSEAYDSIENLYQMILKKLEIQPSRHYCDYIIPKIISKDIFDQKIQTMKTKEIYFENDMSLDQVERELSSILQRNNFHIVEKELDPINSELKGIKGFAEGKYDKQEIALIIAVQKVNEGNNLIKIISMSTKEWIAEEILKDINVKSNILKSTHVLLREYSEKIEAVMEKIADLEEFLTKNLGSELDKLRDVLNKYNRAEISRSELIKSGADLIGKSFLTTFIKRYFSEGVNQEKKG